MTSPSTRPAPAATGCGRTVLQRRLAVMDLPLPGSGRTADRHRALFDLARSEPVSVARLAEAHTDAVAILAEAGQDPVPGAAYGVWASAGGLVIDPAEGTMSGTKPFCSGLGIVDRALVTARLGADGDAVLVDIPVTPCETFGIDTDGWGTPALRDSATGMATLDRHPVSLGSVVGKAGWYLDRPGFWHGACGPAACWAGAAAGLVDTAEALGAGNDPHRLAHLGAMRSSLWALTSLLDAAGDQIDASPTDALAATHRAQALRQVVERTCTDLLDHFSRSLGPRPFVGDEAVTQRAADLHLYLRQHHAEQDMAQLGALPLAGG